MKHLLDPNWQKLLAAEFEKPYWHELETKVTQAYQNSVVFPPKENIFNAFNLCSLDKLKVVIIGQDPYHGQGQAHGLAFSVPDKVKIPPSLKNIYKEIESDIGTPISANGNLQPWAKQGVLLLNATLTVEESKAGAHQKFGWETFTDAVIENISKQKEHVVFLLWGAFAESKASLIDDTKHLVLKTTHPSPLSAYRGFLGCQHFSQTNQYLKKHSQPEIIW